MEVIFRAVKSGVFLGIGLYELSCFSGTNLRCPWNALTPSIPPPAPSTSVTGGVEGNVGTHVEHKTRRNVHWLKDVALSLTQIVYQGLVSVRLGCLVFCRVLPPVPVPFGSVAEVGTWIHSGTAATIVTGTQVGGRWPRERTDRAVGCDVATFHL
jgi:hypothetical protein